jgi:ribonuclease R
LIGDESGDTYRVGQKLQLRLADANPVTGSLRFELPEGSYGGPRLERRDRVRRPPVRGKRGRPPNIRHQGKRR